MKSLRVIPSSFKLPPSCEPSHHNADDLCALLSQLHIREDPVDWTPWCSPGATSTVQSAIQRLAMRARARLCRKGRLAYDASLRDAEYDVDVSFEVSRLTQLLDSVAAMTPRRRPGALFGLHRAVRKAWRSPATKATLTSGINVAVLGDRFDLLTSVASVQGSRMP